MIGSLAAAVIIGIAFGWTLERAGLGSAPKLAGQFYRTDFTVFKVMFSAIVTAMLGAFWLSRLGLLDLGRVYVPETYLLPQFAGGLLFGVGFVMAGLCPGTSCVAAASGRGDGAMVMLGMFSGVLATGLAFAPLNHFYESTARGSLTLPDWLHVPYRVVVFAVVAMALIAFQFLSADGRRWNRRTLSAIAALLGILALFGGNADILQPKSIAPIQLAEWIRDRKPGLRIIDVRSEEQFEAYHLPRAERMSMASLSSLAVKPDQTIVLVAQVIEDQRFYILRGGLRGWFDEVMNPTMPAGAPPAVRAAFERTSAISRYFGGVPRVVDQPEAPARYDAAAIRRRGC
jgi:rhodanese-related sulfurtransferase/uncharacterized membrane protein YedE/YeeE